MLRCFPVDDQKAGSDSINFMGDRGSLSDGCIDLQLKDMLDMYKLLRARKLNITPNVVILA